MILLRFGLIGTTSTGSSVLALGTGSEITSESSSPSSATIPPEHPSSLRPLLCCFLYRYFINFHERLQDPFTPNHVPFKIPIPQLLQHAQELRQNRIGNAMTSTTTITASQDMAPSIPSNFVKVKWLIEKFHNICKVSICSSCFSVWSMSMPRLPSALIKFLRLFDRPVVLILSTIPSLSESSKMLLAISIDSYIVCRPCQTVPCTGTFPFDY